VAGDELVSDAKLGQRLADLVAVSQYRRTGRLGIAPRDGVENGPMKCMDEGRRVGRDERQGEAIGECCIDGVYRLGHEGIAAGPRHRVVKGAVLNFLPRSAGVGTLLPVPGVSCRDGRRRELGSGMR
jgi:hypothetical protein